MLLQPDGPTNRVVESPFHIHKRRVAILLEIIGPPDRVEIRRHSPKIETQHLRVYPAVVETDVDVGPGSMGGGMDLLPEPGIGLGAELEPGVEFLHLDEKL